MFTICTHTVETSLKETIFHLHNSMNFLEEFTIVGSQFSFPLGVQLAQKELLFFWSYRTIYVKDFRLLNFTLKQNSSIVLQFYVLVFSIVRLNNIYAINGAYICNTSDRYERFIFTEAKRDGVYVLLSNCGRILKELLKWHDNQWMCLFSWCRLEIHMYVYNCYDVEVLASSLWSLRVLNWFRCWLEGI